MLKRLAVVVPAHNEEGLLPDCLEAIEAAAGRFEGRTEVVVAADDCDDGTATVAEAAGAEVVRLAARRVGAARAAGFAHALRHGTDGLWLATTDADSLVAPDWLLWHAGHAARGTEVLVGTVGVDDWTPWPVTVRDAYERHYRAALRHVHGANLGCDARAYLRLGGFAAVPHDEDVDFVRRAVAGKLRVRYDAGSPVITSSRRHARAPSGFAAHLADLADEVSLR
ncbi:glycosyltransferase [Actinoplanes friuliensis]|uniref:4,4'-diaponeurosporenoate glycosyltransferase n=1 Tax=Actinoplanes friuliensis DSM 7358 TaxID=1246995 RepID=U5W0Y5_9ACTN|nr:glycosyltransferase [Actinoplanes friuliensis]AGZ42677.1 glycosyltransferase [Actinoplanes friuliensis DSM 7358]